MGRRTDKTAEKNGISKTNVMRILDQKKAKYEAHSYESTGAISGNEVAAALGQDERQVFKTLVASGHRGQLSAPWAREKTKGDRLLHALGQKPSGISPSRLIHSSPSLTSQARSRFF